MKDIETHATIKVLGCRKLENVEKDKPTFEILYNDVEMVKFGEEETFQEIQKKCKSFLNLEKGEHRVIVSFWKKDQFSKPIYKVLRKVETAKK